MKLFSTFGANGLDVILLLVCPNVNVLVGVLGCCCPKGLTGVGPVPKLIVPTALLPLLLVSIRVGLSSMFIPSSGLDGGVMGRVGAPKVKGDEVEAVEDEAAGWCGFAPKGNMEPDEDVGA